MLTWQLYCVLVRGTGRAGTRAKKERAVGKTKEFHPRATAAKSGSGESSVGSGLPAIRWRLM